MRYTKRFAGLALALGTMLMGVGTMSAADRKDAYQDRAPLTEAVRDGRQAVPARTFAIAAKRDSRNQVRKVHYDWRKPRHGRDLRIDHR
jgi:hypothetical protein